MPSASWRTWPPPADWRPPELDELMARLLRQAAHQAVTQAGGPLTA